MYDEGCSCFRFFSEDKVREKAAEVWKKLFPKAEVLVEGNIAYAEPQLVLAGPETFKETINRMTIEIEYLNDNFHEKEEEYYQLLKEYDIFLKEYNWEKSN